MNSILFDLSGKIDQQTVDALYTVKSIADSLGIPFFIVGASARDFILERYYGIAIHRRTKDIDLGVEIDSWEQFDKLSDALISTGKFFPDKREPQRFHCNSLLIDIVPFGSIADENRKIAWPPEHEIFMSMVGFKEAYEYSVTVRLSSDPELDIKLPTLPGLALMKIISWQEKYPVRDKDAEDLLLIMHKYEEAGNFDRLYNKEQDVMQEENFDARLASIRLLGRDMGKMADADTLTAVSKILDDETGPQSQHRLAIDMIKGSFSFDEKFDETLLQIEKLRKGISEVQQ